MSDRLNCPACYAHDVTENHIGRCVRQTEERDKATAHGAGYGVPPMTTADLWAHLGHVGNAEDRTRIVRQVLDLGWRPVVGKEPKRLWSRDGERADPQDTLFGGVA